MTKKLSKSGKKIMKLWKPVNTKRSINYTRGYEQGYFDSKMDILLAFDRSKRNNWTRMRIINFINGVVRK